MHAAIDAMLRDTRPLYDAASAVLGYRLSTWYRAWLNVTLASIERWAKAGLLTPRGDPAEAFRRVRFDFELLGRGELEDLCGFYFFVYASHAKANGVLRKGTRPRVLYLRGYDFDAAVRIGGELAMAPGTVDTARMSALLGEHVAPWADVFKVLSPREVEFETVGLDRYFRGDYAKLARRCSEPVRAVYLNARHWQPDLLSLMGAMDHHVAYVSSTTASAQWELDQLEARGDAGRTTVVFDRRAIETKALHSKFHDELPSLGTGEVLARPAPLAPTAEDVDALRAALARRFHLVEMDDLPPAFAALRARVESSAATRHRDEAPIPLPFRLQPALDDDALERLRAFDVALWETVDPTRLAAVDVLPHFLALVQLRILSALLLGQHRDAARALACLAGALHGTRAVFGAAGRIDARVSEDYVGGFLEALQERCDQAARIALHFLRDPLRGPTQDQVHEGEAVFDRDFGAARALAVAAMRASDRPDAIVVLPPKPASA
jgi:hypothetical protein